MNLFRILLLLFGSTNIAYSNDLEVVNRRIQSSMNYGSYKYSNKIKSNIGSGVENKYSGAGSHVLNKLGSHGSYAFHKNGGSGHTSQSGRIYGSNSGHSNSKYMSAYIFSAVNGGSGTKYGSGKYSGSSVNRGSLPKYGSNSRSGQTYGSGANRGSGKQCLSYSLPNTDRLFAPTMYPTETMMDIYELPQPTFSPTESRNMPKIKLTFEKSNDVSIPNMPLTFQIKQGANGWSNYGNMPPILTKEVSKITGLDKQYITGMNILHSTQRKLLSSFYFYYNITTPPISTDNTYVKSIYNNIIYKLTESVKNGNFTNDLWKQGYKINVTNIQVSSYSIIPQSSNSIENHNDTKNNLSLYIYVTAISIVSAGLLFCVFGYIYKRRLANKIEPSAKVRDSIPNPLHTEPTN